MKLLTVLLASLFMITPPVDSGEPHEELLSLLEVVEAGAACDWYCRWCMTVEEHEVIPGDDQGYEAFHYEECQTSGDCTDHFCWSEDDDVQEQVELAMSREALGQLVAALKTAHGTTLRTFVSQSDGLARFNAGRRSIQLEVCPGRILANIPLDPTRAAAFE